MKTTLGFLVDEEVKIVAEIDVEVIINGFEVLPSQVRNKKDSLGSLYIYIYIYNMVLLFTFFFALS